MSPSLSPSEGEVQPAQAKKPRTTEGSAGSFICPYIFPKIQETANELVEVYSPN